MTCHKEGLHVIKHIQHVISTKAVENYEMQVLVYVSRFVNNKVWIQSQQVEIGPSVAGTVSTCPY